MTTSLRSDDLDNEGKDALEYPRSHPVPFGNSCANDSQLTHRLYDRITSDAPEYYLFPDELNLLKTHGDSIARSMGFPGRSRSSALLAEPHRIPVTVQKDTDDIVPPTTEEEEIPKRRTEHVPAKPWRPARWGEYEVGEFNGGVNGEEGLGGGWEKGWDVVELGAG